MTVQDLALITLREPRVEHDSLYGIVAERYGSLERGDSVAIHVAHVSSIEARGVNAVGTTAGIVGGLVAVGTIALMIAAASMDNSCTVSSGSGC